MASGIPIRSVAATPLIEPKAFPGPLDPTMDAVIRVLVEDTHLPLAGIDLGGVYRFCSPAKARLLGAAPEQVVGRPVEQYLSPDQAGERRELIARCAGGGRPLLVESTIFGAQARSIMRLAPGTGEAGPIVVIVHHLGHACGNVPLDRERYDVVRSRIAPPIPLAHLTGREREVLALIARGHTQAQIAEKLNRSVKTVEWHRASLGKKLGVGSAVELAYIAIQHGLVPLGGPKSTP